MHIISGAHMLLDKIGLRLTIGGSATATASGAAAASTTAPAIISLAEIGVVLGIMFGAVGVVIQVVRWIDERKVMRAELALIKSRGKQELEAHEARMVAGDMERRRNVGA